MSREITLDDLASGGQEAAEQAAAAADGDGGEWVLDLYERLQDDGMLQAILFGPDALPEADVEAGDVPAPGEQGGGGSVDIDAHVIADALEDVQATVGDLRVSQLVSLTRENPDLVDDLLEAHLQDATVEESEESEAADGD